MKAEITTFPAGMAEGLPVLKLDFEGAAFDAELADRENARHRGARGLWGVWLDGLESWDDRDLDSWIDAQPVVICLRPLEARDWPAVELNTVLGLTEAMKQATDIDKLADYASRHASHVPVVQDLTATIEIGTRAPLSSALDLLVDFAAPEGQGFIYTPDDHPQRGLILRAITQCSSMWALRKT